MIDEILNKNSLMIYNGKDKYNCDDVKNSIMTLVNHLNDLSISHKLVAIVVNDNLVQFFLMFALWQRGCNIMCVNPLNGRDYCMKVFESYQPEYIISEDIKLNYLMEERLSNSIQFENVSLLVYRYGKGLDSLVKKRGVIFFTSGTTSIPKAVFRSKGNILNDAHSNITTFDITKDDGVLIAVPVGHVYGFGSGIIPFAFQGATIYLTPPLLTGRKLKRIIENNNITAVIGTPIIYQEIIDANIDITQCRLLLSAGSKISNKLFDDFYKKYNKEINNMYGSSETGAIATLFNCPEFDGDSSNCGKPMDTISVKCDGTKDTIDKVYVKSESIADGIICNDEFFSLVDREGWYETNDMGYIDESDCLHLVCRINEVINIGGEKINPKVIESFFESDYGETKVTTEMGDSGFEYPVVYVTSKDFDLEYIKNEIEKNISKRFMPKKIYVVKEFPRNIAGKIIWEKLEKADKEMYFI